MKLALREIGLSQEMIIYTIILLGFLLVLLLIFILIGISSCKDIYIKLNINLVTFPGAFGSVIKSLFPIAGGLAFKE